MAMIHKSVEAKKHKEKISDGEKHPEKHHHKKLKHQKHTSSSRYHFKLENAATKAEEKRNTSYLKSSKYKERSDSEDEYCERDVRRKKNPDKDWKYKELSPSALSAPMQKNVQAGRGRNNDKYQCEKPHQEDWINSESAKKSREDRRKQSPSSPCKSSDMVSLQKESWHKRQNSTIKLSKEERAAKLQEMQMDAELHEEQRWKRLRKAEEDDAKEATRASMSSGRNFLDAAHKSVYGAEKGGSSTIEESVRRRTHYLQRTSQEGEGNAFRR